MFAAENTTETLPLIVDAREAARLLSMSERSLWSLTVPRGPLPCIRFGKRAIRYARKDLELWIEQAKQNEPQVLLSLKR